MRIQEIKLPIAAFLRPAALSLGEFRREWGTLPWEASGGLNSARLPTVQAALNAAAVHEAPCGIVQSRLLSCTTAQGELLLVALQDVDGRATVRAKGASAEVVRGVVAAVAAL